jgi:hypothetical protein
VTVRAFDGVGGIPDISSGEDRAFVRALWMADAAVRHDPAIEVTVSGRIHGRARNGMADTIRRRIVQQDEFTDDAAEPAADAYRRYRLRRQFREAWKHGPTSTLPADLFGVSRPKIRAALQSACFGAGWALLENESCTLKRNRVRFCELPAEIMAAGTLLAGLRPIERLAAD